MARAHQDSPWYPGVGIYRDTSIIVKELVHIALDGVKITTPGRRFGASGGCPPGSLHDRTAKDWELVRSYTIKDGHLFLSLMADGGLYDFEPISR